MFSCWYLYMKTCTKCKLDKESAAFYSDSRSSTGLRPICKSCHRNETIKRVYGLTSEDYDRMLVSQDGRCGICRRRSLKRRLAIDHNHKTKAVRGLLCQRCNRALGSLGDNLENVMRFVRYLEAAGE